jgi:hypothetical protein
MVRIMAKRRSSAGPRRAVREWRQSLMIGNQIWTLKTPLKANPKTIDRAKYTISQWIFHPKRFMRLEGYWISIVRMGIWLLTGDSVGYMTWSRNFLPGLSGDILLRGF